MLNQMKKNYVTLYKVHSSPQFLIWSYLKFSTQRKQYLYIQLAIFFLITFYCSIKSQYYVAIIVYSFCQVSFISLIILIPYITKQQMMKHRIHQILMILIYTNNQVMLLLPKINPQIMTIIIAGYILGWTFYNMIGLEFRLFQCFLCCGIFYHFNEDQTCFLVVGFLLILVLGTLCMEYNLISLYQNYISLFSIIERMPNAICIVDKHKTQLVYSNENFQNLASTLSQSFHGNFSQENALNELRQLNFLQNLYNSQVEIKNEGFQISEFFNSNDDDQGISKDQFKIKKVFFDKNRKLPTFSDQVVENLDQKQIFSNVYKQELQSLVLGQPPGSKIQNKAFIADIILEMELQHDPSRYIQSARTKKKNRKNKLKHFNETPPSLFSPKLEGTKSRKSQLLSDSNFQFMSSEQYKLNTKLKDLPQSQTIVSGNIPLNQSQYSYTNTQKVEHKIKFMVQLMENCNSYGLQEELQIFFISELSPFLLKTKVKKLEQVQKNLLRSISHELVTYLNGAYGYMDLVHQQMQQKNYDQEKVFQWVTLSIQYITLQIHKIQDLCDFKALLSGQFLLNYQIFFLDQAIEECILLMMNQSQQKGIILELEIDPHLTLPLRINSDKQRFCQILLNLLSNAMRFTFKGGITVVLRQAVSQDLQDLEEEDNIQAYQNIDLQNMIEISVIDTGLGMKEDQLGTLTKKLLISCDDEQISQDSIGISMGLMLCKQILKLMGPDPINTIFVKSIKDQGSNFYFYLNSLPFTNSFQEKNSQYKQSQKFLRSQSFETCKISHSESKRPNRIKVNNTHSSLRKYVNVTDQRYSKSPLEQSFTCVEECQCNCILIVDDESFNIDVLTHLVKQMGFETDFSFNGKECIEKLENRILNHCKFDSCIIYKCIMMDINMPIMNGWEAAANIKLIQLRSMNLQQYQSKIPIIAVTAFGNPSDQEKCLQAGFDYVIVKPATKKTIQAAFNILNIHFMERKLQGHY